MEDIFRGPAQFHLKASIELGQLSQAKVRKVNAYGYSWN